MSRAQEVIKAELDGMGAKFPNAGALVILGALEKAGWAVTQLPASDRGWITHWTVDPFATWAAGDGCVYFEDKESATTLDVATADGLAAALLAASQAVLSEGAAW